MYGFLLSVICCVNVWMGEISAEEHERSRGRFPLLGSRIP